MDELWQNTACTQKVWLYSCATDDMAHIAVQLQPNDMVQKMFIIVLVI
jgi:hypothetical protein